MRSLTRLLLAGASLIAFAPLAQADLTVLDGTAASQVMFDFTCFTTKHCSAHVNINQAGTEIFTVAAPGSIAAASGALAPGSMVDFLTTRQTMAAGTAATNSQAVGGQYNSSPITLTNTQGAALQLDANGYTKVNCTVGCSGGTFNNNADNVATSSTNGQVAAFNYVWDGSAWDRLYGDSVNGVKVNIVAGGGTGGGATGDVNNAASAAGYQQMLAIGRYDTTQPTLTTAHYNALQVSARGELLVATGVSGLSVNATIVGGLLSAGPANMAASAPVTIATDQSAVKVVNGGSQYETVAASQTAQTLGPTGATGDYLSHCVIYPTSTTPGVVTVFDNSSAAGTNVIAFPGGASSVSNLAPISVPVGALSTAGAWKATTGADLVLTCYGRFT